MNKNLVMKMNTGLYSQPFEVMNKILVVKKTNEQEKNISTTTEGGK